MDDLGGKKDLFLEGHSYDSTKRGEMITAHGAPRRRENWPQIPKFRET